MKVYLLIILTSLTFQKMLGQSTTPGNAWTGFPNEYAGWDNTSNTSLRFKHELALPMQFYTGAGTGTFINMRMSILGGYTVSGGLIGLGDMGTLAAPFTPTNLLHLHRAGNIVSLYQQFTNLNTGITATDGLLFGMRHDIPSNWDIAEIRHQENAPFALWTGDNAGVNQRIFVHNDNMAGFAFTPLTRVGIVENGVGFGLGVLPRSLLHIGFPDALTNGGYRTWMDVGTFYHAASDLAYTGLKLEPWSSALWDDHMDAVVGWGDNINGPEGADNLRFIFSAIQQIASRTAGQFNGLEVARFTPTGRFGIGNFTQPGAGAGTGVQPARHLEVYGENLDAWLNAAAPQLRLTFTPATSLSPTTTGIWTDFENTAAGNFTITTTNAGVVQNTGIGSYTGGIVPARRLDVLDQGANLPQLRLTYRPNATITSGIWTDFQTTSTGDLYIHPRGFTSFPFFSVVSDRYVGINTSTPGNTVEINSGITSPVVSPARQIAGLRFTNLTASNSPLAANPFIATLGTPCVLSVDANGDVVLVDDQGGSGVIVDADNGTSLDVATGTKVELGNPIGGTSAKLLDDREIPMANHNVVFTDPSPSIDGNYNAVGIGTSGPVAKLDVNRALSSTAVLKPICVNILSADKSSNGSSSYALISEINGTGNANNYSGSFISSSARVNTAVQGIAMQAVTASGANDENRASQFDAEDGRINFGVLSKAKGGETTYGIDIDASNGTIQNYGLRANIGSSAASVINNYGINAIVNSSTNNRNYGSKCFVGGDLSINYGVYGWSQSNTTSGTNTSINSGGYFLAEKGLRNYGVYAEALGQSNSTTNIGVVAKASGSTVQNYGIYAECLPACSSAVCVNTAGYFRGDVVSTSGYFISSDIKFKNNIVDINNGISTINQLLPKTYEYQNSAFPSMTFPFGTHAGLIAEDVGAVLPNVLKNALQPETYDSLGNVTTAAVDYLAVNYIEIIPYLIAAVKEQQLQINDLQAQLINCCGAPRPANPPHGGNEKTGAVINVKLSNSENCILYQNEPNPYHNETTIRYFIPENTLNVKITFQDEMGRTLKEVEITGTGAGSIKVDGNDLINGIYTYSLVINGKIEDTKKMIKAN